MIGADGCNRGGFRRARFRAISEPTDQSQHSTGRNGPIRGQTGSHEPIRAQLGFELNPKLWHKRCRRTLTRYQYLCVRPAAVCLAVVLSCLLSVCVCDWGTFCNFIGVTFFLEEKMPLYGLKISKLQPCLVCNNTPTGKSWNLKKHLRVLHLLELVPACGICQFSKNPLASFICNKAGDVRKHITSVHKKYGDPEVLYSFSIIFMANHCMWDHCIWNTFILWPKKLIFPFEIHICWSKLERPISCRKDVI